MHGNAKGASQAVHLKTTQRVDVLLHDSRCGCIIQQHSHDDALEKFIFIDKVKALEDQMLARLSCWKALFAAATLCVISALKVWSEVKQVVCQPL